MTVGGMGFIPERLLMMMMMIYIYTTDSMAPGCEINFQNEMINEANNWETTRETMGHHAESGGHHDESTDDPRGHEVVLNCWCQCRFPVTQLGLGLMQLPYLNRK